jgi:hypothetical protein
MRTGRAARSSKRDGGKYFRVDEPSEALDSIYARRGQPPSQLLSLVHEQILPGRTSGQVNEGPYRHYSRCHAGRRFRQTPAAARTRLTLLKLSSCVDAPIAVKLPRSCLSGGRGGVA